MSHFNLASSNKCVVQRGVTKIQVGVQSLQELSQQNKLEEWLAAPDPSTNYHKALKQRHASTGTWLLESEAFTHWKQSSHSFLWLHGIPGCGKTVLSTSVIEELQRQSKADTYCSNVVYFYFDFNEKTKQTVDNMARSLISQCSRHAKVAQQQLDDLFGRHENGKKQPSTESLLAALQATLQKSGCVQIVLDALDECTTRKELLLWIRELFPLRIANIQLFATSRREHDIQSNLTQWANAREMLSIQGELVNEDIRSYVEFRVKDHNSPLKRWHSRPDVQRKIATKLIEKAGAM
jgi:Cdc6-like AAA superfamily ATPase